MTEPSALISAVPPSVAGRPASNPAVLMGLYDANYHCLLALCPPLRNPDAPADRYRDGSLPGRPTLQLEFHDQACHTATFGLACRWDDAQTADVLPEVQVRLYRDSRQAELLGCLGHPLASGGLHRRHAGNQFLLNWLRYCLRQGYYLGKDPGRAS